jgi:N-acetyl sugar amidotransferase
MAQCKACLYTTDHPLGLTLIDGLCSGCITHKEKYIIDWDKKYQELESIANWAKDRSKTYDCVVPVVGDAEDYYVVSKVLELDLNPLIVSVNSYFLNDIGWSNLQNLITYFDLDSWIYNPDIQTYKELIRTSLRKHNHMYLPWLQLHTSFPVHVAKEKKIPLVVWGGNQAVEQVGKFSHYDKVEMSSWSRVEHDLFGNDIETLMGNGAQVNERKVNYYHYPSISSLGKNTKGIYLSNYMLWDPLKQNHSTLAFDFKPELSPYTFDPYERAGSSIYYGIHDILKMERVGYRKSRDHVCREIRHNRISKSEGEHLIDRYAFQVNITPFFNWLGVSASGQDWFKKHKLAKTNYLISDEQSEFEVVVLPTKLDKLSSNCEQSKSQFLKFHKGLSI